MSRKNEIEEFSYGLKHLGFLDFLCKHKETCKVLLTGAEYRPVSQFSKRNDHQCGNQEFF